MRHRGDIGSWGVAVSCEGAKCIFRNWKLRGVFFKNRGLQDVFFGIGNFKGNFGIGKGEGGERLRGVFEDFGRWVIGELSCILITEWIEENANICWGIGSGGGGAVNCRMFYMIDEKYEWTRDEWSTI